MLYKVTLCLECEISAPDKEAAIEEAYHSLELDMESPHFSVSEFFQAQAVRKRRKGGKNMPLKA